MKNVILSISSTFLLLSMTAFSYVNLKNSQIDLIRMSNGDIFNLGKEVISSLNEDEYLDFNYDIGPRFEPIKKEFLLKAESIDDFLERDEKEKIAMVKSINVIVIENDIQTEKRELGNTQQLNEAQLELIRSRDYSMHFLIKADFYGMNYETGLMEDYSFSPHLTVVPEKQAKYNGSKEDLLAYARNKNRENTKNLKGYDLQPAKLYFTINKDASISNIHLDRTSGVPAIDKTMIELIQNLPGNWEAAENSKGEKVEQELVLSFGMIDC